MKQFDKKNAERRGEILKSTDIVSRNLEFGLGRKSEAILRAKPLRLRRVFRSMSDAIEWVKAPLEKGRGADG